MPSYNYTVYVVTNLLYGRCTRIIHQIQYAAYHKASITVNAYWPLDYPKGASPQTFHNILNICLFEKIKRHLIFEAFYLL